MPVTETAETGHEGSLAYFSTLLGRRGAAILLRTCTSYAAFSSLITAQRGHYRSPVSLRRGGHTTAPRSFRSALAATECAEGVHFFADPQLTKG